MNFTTTTILNDWIEQHKKECGDYHTWGEQFRFEFWPSGITERQRVVCLECGEEYSCFNGDMDIV